MREDNNIVLSTKGLSVGYGNKREAIRVLEGINVELKAGEMVCFMGENGAGKSTLLRTITGLQSSIEGEVMIHQKPLNEYKAHQLATKISVVLTDRLNVGLLSVYELIAMGRYPYLGWNVQLTRADEEQIDLAIDLTHTEKLTHKKVHTLSDGQLQKVMIARALAQDAPVMILDEPTAHLDLNNRVEVIRLLHDLSRSTGKAILMATHELDLALQMADRLWLVNKNKSITSGIPEDLVLNGTMDDVFSLKGYDLKTGKITHQNRGMGKVQLKGEGYAYLWTKNALEREGYSVGDSAEQVQIEVQENDGSCQWISNASSGKETFSSVADLLNRLKSLLE